MVSPIRSGATRSAAANVAVDAPSAGVTSGMLDPVTFSNHIAKRASSGIAWYSHFTIAPGSHSRSTGFEMRRSSPCFSRAARNSRRLRCVMASVSGVSCLRQHPRNERFDQGAFLAGNTPTQIAARMGVSAGTVDIYRNCIMVKLEISRLLEAVDDASAQDIDVGLGQRATAHLVVA